MMGRLATLLVAAVTALVSAGASAQEWPTRPLHMIVGAGPGGGTDIVTRIIGQPLSELLGQPVVVENKQGPANMVASTTLVRAAKDGYTSYMINNSHGIVGALYKNLPYDPVNDFSFVSFTGVAGLVLVTRKDFPANNVRELIAAAKAQPGKFNFSSVGNGTTQHFSGELFRQLAGVDVKHIPYRSTPASVTGLLAGEVDFTFELVQAVLGQIRAGELKALAVTGPVHEAALPELPTVAESGLPSFQVMSWYGLTMPAGTPDPVIAKMNKALHDVLARADIRAALIKVGATAKSSTPEELRQHVINEIAKWNDVREKAGIEKRE